MDSVSAPHHRSRWSLLSLLALTAPLAILNPSLADPLKQLETGFCSGCALSGADLRLKLNDFRFQGPGLPFVPYEASTGVVQGPGAEDQPW